jgi:hypothetical protein
LVERGLGASLHQGTIVFVQSRLGGSFLHILGAHVLAVDIGHQHDVAHLGRTFPVLPGHIGHSHPIGDEHDSGLLALGRGIIDHEPFQGRSVLLIGDRFGFDGRRHGRGGKQRSQGQGGQGGLSMECVHVFSSGLALI